MKSKFINFIERNSKILLLILFIVGVIIYGYLASKMNCISHVNADEELYINMAKSFFYEGCFQSEYEIINYNCVIYSIIISIAYFFYSPENILFFMRLIGVILMVSSIFPIYLLSKKILNSKAKAIGIACINLILPEIVLTFFIIQEVLLYPLFMWTLYLIYLKFAENDSKMLDFAIIFMLAIMFFTKSYAISFGIAYFIAMLIIYKKDGLKKILVCGIIYAIFIGIGYFIIYVINDFQIGTNHYSSQISSIFPITLNTFKNLLYGIFYYTVFFVFCSGIAPILYPLFKMNRYEKVDKRLICFLLLCAVITIIEVATIVFIPEESDKLYPSKMCFRYLCVLSIPFLIMFLKLKNDDIKTDKKIIIVYAIIFIYLIWYYIGQETSFAIIDAPFLFVIQYIFEDYKALLLIAVFLILSICLLKNKIDIKKSYIIIMIASLFLFTPQYIISCIYCTDRSIYMNDISVISNSIDDNAIVYIMSSYTQSLKETRVIGAHLKNGYYVYEMEDEIKISDEENTYFIIPNEYRLNIENFKKVDIDTEYIDLYVYTKEN